MRKDRSRERTQKEKGRNDRRKGDEKGWKKEEEIRVTGPQE